MPGGDPPIVSVITSTYNRANVLRFTIESLRAQTIADWEMIIVGDACTDDTEDVVNSFGDPRIRFVNRPVNAGEQATPNNDGVRMARGRYLAFLNHDDVWTPGHLRTSIDTLEASRADLVWSVAVMIGPHGDLKVSGAFDRYRADRFIPASSWVFRRELPARVGPWRPAREIFIAPSQEWLFRAWKNGAVLRPTNATTILAISSATHRNTYVERRATEHVVYAERIGEPRFLADFRAEIEARDAAREAARTRSERLRGMIGDTIRRAISSAGFHPHSVFYALKFRRPGGYLDRLRTYRGLPPLPRGRE